MDLVEAVTDTLSALPAAPARLQLLAELGCWCTQPRPWRLQCHALQVLERIGADLAGNAGLICTLAYTRAWLPDLLLQHVSWLLS